MPTPRRTATRSTVVKWLIGPDRTRVPVSRTMACAFIFNSDASLCLRINVGYMPSIQLEWRCPITPAAKQQASARAGSSLYFGTTGAGLGTAGAGLAGAIGVAVRSMVVAVGTEAVLL